MRPINNRYPVRNKYKQYLEQSIQKNELYSVDTLINGEKYNVFKFSNPNLIHSCLSWLEDSDCAPDYILIENCSNKAQLVLLDNKVQLLCLLYNSYGGCERFFPIWETGNKGINHRFFTSSYIVFARVDALLEPISRI